MFDILLTDGVCFVGCVFWRVENTHVSTLSSHQCQIRMRNVKQNSTLVSNHIYYGEDRILNLFSTCTAMILNQVNTVRGNTFVASRKCCESHSPGGSTCHSLSGRWQHHMVYILTSDS